VEIGDRSGLSMPDAFRLRPNAAPKVLKL